MLMSLMWSHSIIMDNGNTLQHMLCYKLFSRENSKMSKGLLRLWLISSSLSQRPVMVFFVPILITGSYFYCNPSIIPYSTDLGVSFQQCGQIDDPFRVVHTIYNIYKKHTIKKECLSQERVIQYQLLWYN